MILVILVIAAFFSMLVAFAFKGMGPRSMIIAGLANMAFYMLGLWLLGVFG